jgi:hypothetical protein
MNNIKLFERYNNYKNIEKLAELVINAITNRTMEYDKWNKGDKDYYENSPITLMSMILPIVISNIDIKAKGFTREFRNFIKDKKQHFRVEANIMSKNSSTRGSYFPDKFKNSKKDIRIELYYDMNDIEDYFKSIDSDIANMNYWNLSKFLNIRKNTLEHELQHAFDDYRSNGKFLKKIINVPNRDSDDYVEKHKEYSNTPHEISAFFTNTATKVLDYGYKNKRDIFSSKHDPSNWKQLLNAFKIEFPNWDTVDSKTQFKLIKRLSNLWNSKFKKKETSIDITDKVKDFESTLRDKYNTEDIRLWYTHDHNYINIYELHMKSVEDEESILIEIVKFSDRHRKTVGITLQKKHTSIYVTKTRKFLRELGFFKNYGSNKQDYRFREEWIRYTKRK